jgi:hypothetical protein
MTFVIHASKDGAYNTDAADRSGGCCRESARPTGQGLGSAYHGPSGPTISPRGIRPPLRVKLKRQPSKLLLTTDDPGSPQKCGGTGLAEPAVARGSRWRSAHRPFSSGLGHERSAKFQNAAKSDVQN